MSAKDSDNPGLRLVLREVRHDFVLMGSFGDRGILTTTARIAALPSGSSLDDYGLCYSRNGTSVNSSQTRCPKVSSK